MLSDWNIKRTNGVDSQVPQSSGAILAPRGELKGAWPDQPTSETSPDHLTPSSEAPRAPAGSTARGQAPAARSANVSAVGW